MTAKDDILFLAVYFCSALYGYYLIVVKWMGYPLTIDESAYGYWESVEITVEMVLWMLVLVLPLAIIAMIIAWTVVVAVFLCRFSLRVAIAELRDKQ